MIQASPISRARS